MIVICEKCLTQFNIDESILDKRGSKVRCNICKNIFIIYPSFKKKFNNKDKEEKIEYLEKNLSFPEFNELLGKEKQGFTTKINIRKNQKKDIKETINLCKQKSPPNKINNQIDNQNFPTTNYHSKQILITKFIYDFWKKSAKKNNFIFLFLLINILITGYIICIIQGINIPYISSIKIQSLNKNMTFKVAAESSDIKLILNQKSVKSRFVINSSAEKLFVITGDVINKSKIPCSNIKVKGTLLTKNKIKVKKKTVFCGNLISQEKIETLEISTINSILSRKTGNNNSNINIKSGDSIPFMIVFSELPENLGNFTINVVKS